MIDKNSTQKIDRTLYLIDCAGEKNSSLLEKINREVISGDGQNYMALFNVAANIDSNIEIEAFMRGYKGFFSENIGLDLLKKGIRAIFDGQLWFSRDVLNFFHERMKDGITDPKQKDNDLTLREKEILTLIVVGCRNEEIADKLCISFHTVKTHIYNLFKKIDVPNRGKAALWAVKNRINL